MKILVTIIRIIVGVLFIFSGLIKANDPAGLSYKMHEFFEVWGMSQFNNLALSFSVLMIAFEIIAGVALLLGWQKKITLWLLLLLIIFFSFLTGYAWLSGKFKSCGCFGDCIPIKPNQSFYKDIVLLVMILILLIFQKYIKPLFGKILTASLLVLAVLFSFFIQKYTLDHLPFKDCLSFKVGNNILEKKKMDGGKKEITMIHEKDGKEFKYTLPNYPTWIEDSTYIFKKREEKVLSQGNLGDIIMDFSLESLSGKDTTKEILSQTGEQSLFLITNLEEKGNYTWEKKFENFAKNQRLGSDSAALLKGSNALYIVTNKAKEARVFFAKYGIASNHVLFCDEKPLLAAARTRPSIMVLKNGTITKKVSWKDL